MNMNFEAPSNGIYIVLGEINLLLANLKRANTNNKYHSNYEYAHDPLSRNFYELKTLLNEHSDLSEIDPSTFITPFLEVIKSEETSGPVTGLALKSVDKFISYGLIGLNNETTANCVQQIADSITHARFVGTDSSSDEVVLMKILHVLRTLMLSHIGFCLTNSSVCEIMQSCFQICFEHRLTELLRRTAESILVDMVQLLFARLPLFKEEIKFSAVKKLTMKGENTRQKKSKKLKNQTSNTTVPSTKASNLVNPQKSTNKMNPTNEKQTSPIQEKNEICSNTNLNELTSNLEAKTNKNDTTEAPSTTDSENVTTIIVENSNSKREKTISESSSVDSSKEIKENTDSNQLSTNQVNTAGSDNESVDTLSLLISSENTKESSISPQPLDNNDNKSETLSSNNKSDIVVNASSIADDEESEYVNPRGVRFVAQQDGSNVANTPYGLPCIRELLRFLISLINTKNTEIMISMGLNLITIGLESGIDHISKYQSLLAYIKDDLCKHLFHLLSSERLSLYASVLRVSFLLFESLRGHLKLQMEHFFIKLMEISMSEALNNSNSAGNSGASGRESSKVSQEQKEMTIDYFLQMLRIPGFAIELYLNYDCFLNCTNLFEDLTKLLSKNAFSVQSLLTVNSLSLSALLAIIENIELENSIIKQNISTERFGINLLSQSSLITASNIRAPPSSGFIAAKNLNSKLMTKSTDQFLNYDRRNNYKQDSSIINNKNHRNVLRVNRMKINAENLPTTDELKAIRFKKRLINQSIDLFNTSPAKSIQFLKDNSIFSNDDKTFMKQLITYLKETPSLDKKVIGEYLSKRNNMSILEEFVRSFNFANLRIDEALRLFLETFRLPGEAPLISIVMENFAKHWRESNQGQFFNDDAAFTLAYAIIMLNVDQHNHNVKKQSTPMVVEEFKVNLRKVNGGGNFDEDLLEEIYHAVKNEEIVMPSEHTGIVRDNYLWKVLIRRGHTSDSNYIHAPVGSYNQEIFSIVWGQTISALSFVYDKSLELTVIQKAINGFRRCAQVAAHYMMSDVFDNIVISLCKFTALSSSQSDIIDNQLAVNFGINNKAQLACKTVFQLTHNHGDILRDGWKNILDCIIQLYKAKLLPKVLIECEDYLNPKGRILLIKEETPIIQSKTEGSGLFSSFFPFMSSDLASNKGPSQEDLEATKNAQSCVDECHIEQLIHDTKFLRVDSLLELIKALIFSSQYNDIDISLSNPNLLNPNSSINQTSANSLSISNNNLGASHSNSNSNNSSLMNSGVDYSNSKLDVDAAVFSLEILVKVVLQNRDRISCIWTLIRNHFLNIIVNTNEYSFFLERTVVGLLRITVRLLRREELTNEVLASLRMLLLFKKQSIIKRLSRQVSFGIHDLLRTNAANIYSNEDWSNIFTILQVYGAGATGPIHQQQQQQHNQNSNELQNHQQQQNLQMSRSASFSKQMNSTTTPVTKFLASDLKAQSNESLNLTETLTLSDRGYTSDSELYQQQQAGSNTMVSFTGLTNLANQYKIDLDDEGLGQHDKKAFAKCCEILTLLIRDMAHITLHNFEICIHCLRTFVEACVVGDNTKETKKAALKKSIPSTQSTSLKSKTAVSKSKSQQMDSKALLQNSHKRSNSPRSDESDEDDQFITSYETISIQLLDLLDTLHTKAASIFTLWAEEQRHIIQQTDLIDSVVSNLWSKCWCPILQGIARLSCDSNGEVRMHALQYLQRALLVHELQTLSAMEWEACFNKVLFPLLAKLLENIDPKNAIRMEETRMRASTLLCKVFLQHLTTLARLSTFTALWLTILDYMDKYMKSDKSDLLHDVIPESLKNMLLVMETTGLFNQMNPESVRFSQLCAITKDRIESFLPGLWEDLFKQNIKNTISNNNQNETPNEAVVSIPNEEPSKEVEETNKQPQKSQEENIASNISSENVNPNNNPEQIQSNLNVSPIKNKSTTEIKDV